MTIQNFKFSGLAAASYSRFSSNKQDEHSIEQQQAACAAAATKNGHVIDSTMQFSDQAVSGTKLKRSGLNALLVAAASNAISGVYFYSLSRLARESVISMPILKELVHVHNVRVISVTEGLDSNNPGWHLNAAILSIQHEQYISELAASVRRGQADNVLRNLAVGDHCFGYKSEPLKGFDVAAALHRRKKIPKVYAVEPESAKWVLQIFTWFAVERRSISWIVQELNRLSVPTDHRSRTQRWRHHSVVAVLRNRKYIGIWHWGCRQNTRNPLNGTIKQKRRDPEESRQWTREFPDLRIIEDGVFEAAQEILNESAAKTAACRGKNGKLCGSTPGAAGRPPRHLLGGVMVCGGCDHRLYVGGSRARYLYCPNAKAGLCSRRKSLRRDLAERLILATIRDRLETNNFHQDVYNATLEEWQRMQSERPQTLANVEESITVTGRRIKGLVDWVEKGDADPSIKQRLSERRAELAALERERERLQRHPEVHPEPTVAWVTQEIGRISTVLHGDHGSAAEALRALVGGRIVVNEVRVPGRRRTVLRGSFTIRRGALTGLTSPAANDPVLGEAAVIDFVEPNPLGDQAEEAKRLYDTGILGIEIARALKCSKSKVTKLLKHWSAIHGEPLPDGKQRRWQLANPTTTPPLYQRIADEVIDLYNRGLLLGDIATQLGCDRNTITRSITWWHKSQGRAVPDGRTRRKELGRDSNDVNREDGRDAA